MVELNLTYSQCSATTKALATKLFPDNTLQPSTISVLYSFQNFWFPEENLSFPRDHGRFMQLVSGPLRIELIIYAPFLARTAFILVLRFLRIMLVECQRTRSLRIEWK